MSLVFWIIIIVWAIFGVLSTRTNRDYYAIGTSALIWILLVLLGYEVFGFKF